MTGQQILSPIAEFKAYLKPELYAVLEKNWDVFPEESKVNILNKLNESKGKFGELFTDQIESGEELLKILEETNALYKKVQKKFKKTEENDNKASLQEAESLISNL